MTLSSEAQFLIDFNVHDVATALGMPLDPSLTPLMYGVDANDYGDYAAHVEAQVASDAAAIAATVDVGAVAAALGLNRGGHLLLIGDSITTYRRGWGRMLATVLAVHDVETINCAYSGYTSTHGLELTYTQFLAHEPDAVCIAYGVNDCKRFGDAPEKTLVSLAEYAANLRAMIAAFQAHSRARLILLTPTRVVEAIVNANPAIVAIKLMWRDVDLLAAANAVFDVGEACGVLVIDRTNVLGIPANPALFLEDGLHPNVDGHRLLLRNLLDHLLNGNERANTP